MILSVIKEVINMLILRYKLPFINVFVYTNQPIVVAKQQERTRL